MSLFKGLQAAVLLSASTFALSTLPLITLDNEQLEIRLDHQTQFVGSLREAATPYLGAAGLLSLGFGSTAFGLTVSSASRRSQKQAQTAVTTLQARLEQQEAQLQALKLSDNRLRSAGLGDFVEQAQPSLPASAAASLLAHTSQGTPAAVAATQPMTLHPLRAQAYDPAPSSASTAPAPPPLPAVQVRHTFMVQAGYAARPEPYAPAVPARSMAQGYMGNGLYAGAAYGQNKNRALRTSSGHGEDQQGVTQRVKRPVESLAGVGFRLWQAGAAPLGPSPAPPA